MQHQRFTAEVISGSGRGKTIGTPTINMALEDVPADIKEGIYACWVKIDESWQQGALHYGPRPVFKDTVACEVYVLDAEIDTPPERIDIALVGYLRPVRDFPSVAAMVQQIEDDVLQTRAMLSEHGPPTSEAADS